jgi:tRNA (cytidine56-2'-O)-methyltransferase
LIKLFLKALKRKSVQMEIVILRLGHRLERDKRVTTHVGLVGRALGARGMLLAAEDKGVERSITSVTKHWGGDFFVKTGVNRNETIRNWKQEGGKVCHLTMYGENLLDVIDEIREETEKEKARVMVVVGAEKVPFEVYDAADWNVAVGNQPHSEIAALALFLDYLQQGKELKAQFEHAELEIVPKRKGKEVLTRKGE